MSKNAPLKLIIDTNLWISFIISKNWVKLDPLIYSQKARLIFCAELIQELQATIKTPKLKKYFKEGALDEMLDVFDPFIDFVKIESKVQICRDPKDDFLLALAKDAHADFLITGDKDLLSLGTFKQTKF